MSVAHQRVLEYSAMIREELNELSDAAKKKTWGEFLLELADVLYLVCSLTQEAGLEIVLSAAFSLKHAANMKKSYSREKEAVERAVQLVPKGVSPVRCVRETSGGKYTLCINDKIIKPPDFKQPIADFLVQVAQTEQGNSEVSCVIEQDKRRFLEATPMGRIDDSHPSAFTFANMTMQIDESMSMLTPKVPDEHKQTIGCHLLLASLETSVGTPPDVRVRPEVSRHP